MILHECWKPKYSQSVPNLPKVNHLCLRVEKRFLSIEWFHILLTTKEGKHENTFSISSLADPGGGGGSGGWNPPFFADQCIWMGTYSWNPSLVLGWEPPFFKWLDPPLQFLAYCKPTNFCDLQVKNITNINCCENVKLWFFFTLLHQSKFVNHKNSNWLVSV